MLRDNIELEKLLNGITLQHGRKIPVHTDIYYAGMGYFYISFRRQLNPAEMEALQQTFGRVELVNTIHKTREFRYMLANQRD